MAVGFVGVGAVITRGDVGNLVHGGVGGGEGLVLAGVVCWVLYTLGAADFPGWSPLRFTALTSALGSLTIVAITETATLAGWEPTPTGHDLAAAAPALAYIVLFGALVAVLSWNSAVQRIGAPTAALFGNLIPITTFAIAIAGGYAPNGYELFGALLALASLLAVTALNRASARSPAASAGTSASGAPNAGPLRARLPRRLARIAASR
jgi:drug/metabolite transporter (DMT)-like permease